MNAIIASVFDQPASEQLDYALRYLQVLTGDEPNIHTHYKRFGFTPTQVRLLNYLVERGGNVCTHMQLTTAASSGPVVMSQQCMAVVICRIRKALKPCGVRIESVFGVGYRITKADAAKIAPYRTAGAPPPPVQHMTRLTLEEVRQPLNRHRTPWTPEQDKDLIRMRQRGVSFEECAYELGRRARYVEERYRKLKKWHRLEQPARLAA